MHLVCFIIRIYHDALQIRSQCLSYIQSMAFDLCYGQNNFLNRYFEMLTK